MRKTSVTCDKCGAAILEGMSVLDISVQAGDLARHLYRQIDVCEDCGRGPMNWLAEKPGERPASPSPTDAPSSRESIRSQS